MEQQSTKEPGRTRSAGPARHRFQTEETGDDVGITLPGQTSDSAREFSVTLYPRTTLWNCMLYISRVARVYETQRGRSTAPRLRREVLPSTSRHGAEDLHRMLVQYLASQTAIPRRPDTSVPCSLVIVRAERSGSLFLHSWLLDHWGTPTGLKIATPPRAQTVWTPQPRTSPQAWRPPTTVTVTCDCMLKGGFLLPPISANELEQIPRQFDPRPDAGIMKEIHVYDPAPEGRATSPQAPNIAGLGTVLELLNNFDLSLTSAIGFFEQLKAPVKEFLFFSTGGRVGLRSWKTNARNPPHLNPVLSLSKPNIGVTRLPSLLLWSKNEGVPPERLQEVTPSYLVLEVHDEKETTILLTLNVPQVNWQERRSSSFPAHPASAVPYYRSKFQLDGQGQNASHASAVSFDQQMLVKAPAALPSLACSRSIVRQSLPRMTSAAKLFTLATEPRCPTTMFEHSDVHNAVVD
ncbi:hypothetical protein B0H10DRAFT_2185548 [Mycena sp. CBHHK59/15]|nr:hypothetical protein B0H10DRAFT_2185548 [Mycena sp. CBHHK59/15]